MSLEPSPVAIFVFGPISPKPWPGFSFVSTTDQDASPGFPQQPTFNRDSDLDWQQSWLLCFLSFSSFLAFTHGDFCNDVQPMMTIFSSPFRTIVDDEYQGVVSQASFAMQGPLEVPIVNAIVSRLHCGSLVIDVYVGATGKYIRRKKKLCPQANLNLLGGRASPKYCWFSYFLRTSLRNLCTTEIGINCNGCDGDVSSLLEILGFALKRG